MRVRRALQVRQLTVWVVPVIAVAVLALASAVWGRTVAAVVLGLMVALALGCLLGVGLDPTSPQKAQAAPPPPPTSPGTSGPARSMLSGADLSGADLTGADLRGLDLRDVKLHHAILRNADLRGAKLSQEPEE